MGRSGPVVSALIAARVASGCGDPLTDGDWLGTPEMVVHGGTVPLAPEPEADLALAVVWAPLTELDGAAAERMPIVRGDVGVDRDFGAFELALYDAPPASVQGYVGAMAVGLMTVLAVPTAGLPEDLDAPGLGAMARAVSDDHYVVWVADADEARASAGAVSLLNPIALEDGYNLAVGVCRAGRPSQLLIVPPERVTIVTVDEAKPGQCLDVYWGTWRTP